jgi:hypothetical protein
MRWGINKGRNETLRRFFFFFFFFLGGGGEIFENESQVCSDICSLGRTDADSKKKFEEKQD